MMPSCQPGPTLVQGTQDAPRDSLGARLLVIDQIDDMAPFLMTVVSDADPWMYVSSAHGLTCGRGQAERCLFPYETDDRLHRLGGQVGPISILHAILSNGQTLQWRPFHPERSSETIRRLYKTELSDRVVFEERHEALALTFRYQWAQCQAFGFVRTSELIRHEGGPSLDRIELLDGLRAIMPSGVALSTQQRASALVNAYRRSERVPGHPRIATYALSALIVDRAEPAEALRANVVWSAGLPGAKVHLDERQIARFCEGRALKRTDECRGQPGAYLLTSSVKLAPGERISWDVVADVDRSQTEVVALLEIAEAPEVQSRLRFEVEAGSASLSKRLASADGVQQTGRPTNDVHHLANVLFNCMRGGVFVDDYRAEAEDIRDFILARNANVFARHRPWLDSLPEVIDCSAVVEEARATQDPNLIRLALEYLPLTYSRRHGDPSRPWNTFSIRAWRPDGRPDLYYEGNWRDIFQNWEALLFSFPGFLPQTIAKFVSAMTVDGFNPYRITRDGIDWEVPDAEDPWSNIGYWGDHQIVYLTRLLEAMEAFWPGALTDWLAAPIFSYGDVPYRLKRHEDIVADPRNTIHFDAARANLIDHRVAMIGADGRLVTDADGAVYHATLAEKLLVTVLSKLGQLVLDGGLWMNTQRPEWNDANNALAGYGLSMVTLYHLRRHLALVEKLFEPATKTVLSAEVSAWLDDVVEILRSYGAMIEAKTIPDRERRSALDALGLAFENYRQRVYEHGPTGRVLRSSSELQELCRLAIPTLDHAIHHNRRADGLYHSYNLLTIEPGGDTAGHKAMYEMLEGQVAVLSAGVLSAKEAVSVLDALFSSSMYRPDQRSFMLYPDRPLPRFLEKNVVALEHLHQDALLQKLLDAGRDDIVESDARGAVRFCADFRHAGDLNEALDRIGSEATWASAVQAGRATTLATFERTFNHHAFTGRSGAMFGYEGLGSIYWHMVSKLLLAVQENLRRAIAAGASKAVVAALLAHYERVRAGLGPSKTPQEYGAFPTDPYSHTPRHAGAQQPGMTGQVKEEILTRFYELGVDVRDGRISFGPGLLKPEDFRQDDGQRCLDFTLAGTPIRYRLDPSLTAPVLTVQTGGMRRQVPDQRLDRSLSQHVFKRDKTVQQIELILPPSALLAVDIR